MIKSVLGRKLLLIEDNGELRKEQADYFRAKGNEVREAGTLGDAKRLIKAEDFDAIILDILLPDGEGLEIFDSSLKLPPVIIQTTLGGEYDMLDGFSAGAVDYVVKPCPAQLLEARLALRLLPKTDSSISMHGVKLNVADRTAKFGGKIIPLTGSEFNILHFFMTNCGSFFTANEIYEKVWNAPSLKSTAVKYHISNLRQKLIKYTGEKLILTEFGRGYAFLSEEKI